MEVWASKYRSKAQFLCCSVEGLPVAQMFDDMFQFEHALNAYIPGRSYFPVGFGQLGCSGFIISDPQGNFVSRRTRAFLDFREQAFRDVERLLEPYMVAREPARNEEKKDGSEDAEKEVGAYSASWTEVGIGSMDHEHQECAKALENLLSHPTATNLQIVHDHMMEHFQHEEHLMERYQFGGSRSDPFSAITSHTKDHKLLLDMARDELQRVVGGSSCGPLG